MRPFNLLPAPGAETRHEESQSSAKRIALAMGLTAVLVAIVFGLAFSQARSGANDRHATLTRLQAEVAQTQAASALTAAEAARTQAHLAAVTSAASGRTAWDGLLGQLSRVMPSGAWLESLQTTAAAADAPSTPAEATSTGSASVTTNGLSSSATTAPAAAATLTVTGFARSQSIIPSVLERLALIPALSDVSLQATQRADVAGKKAAQFTINANVQYAGGIG